MLKTFCTLLFVVALFTVWLPWFTTEEPALVRWRRWALYTVVFAAILTLLFAFV